MSAFHRRMQAWWGGRSAGDVDLDAAMLEFVETFPSLRVMEMRAWDPQLLDDWAASVASSGQRAAVAFVLSVYNAADEWKVGRFDFSRAFGVWDQEHRAAFLAWAETPWWP